MLSKANRDKMRTVAAAVDPDGMLRQALDAIGALEAERDALVARWRELEAALRDLLDEITIVIDHPAWRRYELTVKPLRDGDPVEAARQALEGAGDARE